MRVGASSSGHVDRYIAIAGSLSASVGTHMPVQPRDWAKSRSGAQSLKMNIKLKRTGPAPSEAAPKDEGKASDVEILTPSEP